MIVPVPVKLVWVIGAVGSADLLWTVDDKEFRIHTTYVGDGLGSVLQTAIDLSLGSSAAIATLPAEPGGTRIFFTGAAGDRVYAQIVSFSRIQAEDGGWGSGELRWRGWLRVSEFISAVKAMAAQLQERYTEAEYERRWGETLPIEKLAALR